MTVASTAANSLHELAALFPRFRADSGRSVQQAADVFRSMWIVNAQLCRLEGRIGVVAPGAVGDIVISKVDPLDDLPAFAEHETALSHVVQCGRVIVDRSAA